MIYKSPCSGLKENPLPHASAKIDHTNNSSFFLFNNLIITTYNMGGGFKPHNLF